MKTVVLERGMDDLKTTLEQRGYSIVYTDEITGGDISAYIYEDDNTLVQSSFHSSLNNSFTSAATAVQPGILLINAKDKQPDQIISIIENRLYSPLF